MAVTTTLIGNLMQIASLPPSPRDTVDDEWAEHIQLRTIVQQLQSLQRERVRYLHTAGTRAYPELLEWLAQCGSRCSKVCVDQFDGCGQGLRLTEDVGKCERLIAISDFCMMSAVSARRSALGQFVDTDKLLSLMPNVTLAFHLLLEMHDKRVRRLMCTRDSFFAPYIKTLPASYPVPLYWDLHELAALRGSSTFVESLRLFKHVCRQYGYFHNKLSEMGVAEQLNLRPDSFTFDDYRWAVATVMTRQNRVPIGEGDAGREWTLALVPLWDMMNHATHEMTTLFNEESSCLEFEAPKAQQAGEQLTMFYGDRSNADFVVHQGFFYVDHEADFMTHALALDESDSLVKVKALLLRNLTVPTAGDFVLTMMPTLDPQLLAFLRVRDMTKEEVEHALRHPAECALLGAPEGVVSRNNEFKALSALKTRLGELLAAYTVSDAAEEAIIANPSTSPALMCASRLCLSEKRILRHSLGLVETHLAGLRA